MKSDDKYYHRIRTTLGVKTLAFREYMSIDNFAGMHVTKEYNWKAWRWSTDPPMNYKTLVDYLKKRPIFQVPDLKEDLNLRSYEGDEVGRGAGVYDCKSDMFFLYSDIDNWEARATRVQTIRRYWEKDYKCIAPKSNSVAVLHLNGAFPFDISKEVIENYV